MKRVAKFEKVSFEIFKADFLKNYAEHNKADLLNSDGDKNTTDIIKISADTYEENAIREIYDKIKIPERATAHSAGYDFSSPLNVDLCDNARVIPTGIRAKIDDGYVLTLFPRSGLGFKYGLRLSNTVGIIDGDYYYSDNEGHILVSVKSDKPLKIEAGMRFCQGVFLPYGITADDCAAAQRNGGMGSTGIL